MRERHANAVFLDTVVVNRVLVEQLEALADGAVAEASWFEVTCYTRLWLVWPKKVKVVGPGCVQKLRAA